MYLKSLSMRGFKSFANKTSLVFEPGTTVIVGPNGSGKSNIVDAFLWVTGEQNPRSLRSSNMEDVIFGGGALKPPLGTAEVALTFDNSTSVFPIDYAEVTITRRVYRTGGSEYAINGAPCRLTDVQELLLNTGVGKEMYSVVGQGRLDTILNSRPDERRYLIEEAAELGKYKRRKERALRKIAATERNLMRVKDIVAEIRRQLKPLQEQAKVAGQHKRLVNGLRELEVQYILSEIDELEAKRQEYLKRGAKTTKEIEDVQASIDQGRKELAALEGKLEESRERLDSLRERGHILTTNRERVRGLDYLLREKRANLRRQAERSAGDLADLEKDLAVVNKEMDELAEALASRESDREKAAEAADAARVEPALEAEMAGLRERLAQVRGKIRGEESLAAMFGVPETASTDRVKGVVGVLGDLLNVPKEYERAVEAFLGTRLFYLVTKDYVSAKQVIDASRKAKKDWPSLIVNGVPAPATPALPTPQGCTALADVVASNELGKGALSRLFANVFLAKSAEAAFALVKKLGGEDVTFLTPDGDIVSPAVITGGRRSDDLFLGRAKRLADYQAEADKLVSELLVLEERGRTRQGEIAKLKEHLSTADKTLTETRLKLNALADRKTYLSEHIGRLRGKGADAVGARADNAKIRRVDELAGLLERLIEAIDQAARGTNELLEGERRAENTRRQELAVHRGRLAELEKTIAAFEHESHLEEISKAQLEPKVRDLVGQLEGDFELSLTAARKKYTIDRPREELLMEMRGIRAKIDAMGPVNPIAAEEYEEVETRHVELEEQINDLKRSERTLHKVIAIMDRKMAERFMDVFERANEEFKQLFVYMFPEGRAALNLTNPEDPLTTGIEIEAQPSGKRFKKLSLLSGGESAMTAIALLFALFKINPAPFYILDECDVALDDVNLQRLVSLVKMFKDQTQFLVVTHQRRTMETADILYGVSISKDGVSKLVSQRLEEARREDGRESESLAG